MASARRSTSSAPTLSPNHALDPRVINPTRYARRRRRRRRIGVCVVLLAMAAVACTSSPSQTTSSTGESTTSITATTRPPASTSTSVDQAVNTIASGELRSRLPDITADLEGALLGVSTGLSRAERANRFRALERDAGRSFDIGHVFHAWDQAIPTVDDLMHLEDGRILMISWNGADTIEITNGLHDDWIRQQATSVRDLQEPLLLRWLWEMDGQRRRDWVHSGPDYVAAWLRIRSIFDEVGAANADFVWCPNEFLFWEGSDPEPWYPGDENVDWLCADGYNWQTSTAHPEWLAFDDIFGDFVDWAAPRNLPIIIGETGSNEGEAGAKADWLRSLPQILEAELPEIDAIVYFDKNFTAFGHPDWRLDTTVASYEAWIDVSNDPWLNPLAP
ncbi:MAG: hypothetical protein ACI81L_000973 [Verrucomicrobiales bacterium]|jgi:hypothetical protein